MPKYIFRCPKCDAHTTIIRKMSEEKAVKCPKCKIDMVIQLQPVHFDIRGFSSDNGYSTNWEDKE